MTRKHQGFTLIELMIVVAIIAILASVAIPMYNNYLIRTQVAEGIHLSSSAKVAAEEYFQTTGAFATSNGRAGLPASNEIRGNYVSQVELIASGGIEITFGNEVHPAVTGSTVMMIPSSNAGSVSWSCSRGATMPNKYVPKNCRT